MKKKIALFLVAIMILANGSLAFAAYNEKTGTVNGYSTLACIFIEPNDAFGVTQCTDNNSYVTFDLTYKYINVDNGSIYSLTDSVYGNGSMSTGLMKPSGTQYRSYSATGYHTVLSGGQRWTASTNVIY